ncbi:MAG: GNAT family N-acetyltransferase [Thermoleophilaceae bacterium]|nr:GNAT family N-acetyltransferase [Thermoleophilaceae bacterium]
MVELQRAGFRAALIPLLPDEFALPVEAEWRATLAEALAGDAVRALVADAGHALAGLVVYGANRDVEPAPGAGEIRAMFVHPDHWRRGVGRGLVEVACADLDQMGYSAVTLWSLRDNDVATAFYEGLGFERDGAAQTRPGLGAREVRYARSLPYYTF